MAWFFKFPPSELERFTARELLRWHNAALRINKQLNSDGET